MKLYNYLTNEEIKRGDEIRTNTNEKVKVLSLQEPNLSHSLGRVTIQHLDGSKVTHFPYKITAKWRNK